MFWEVWLARYGETYFFRSRENAIDYAKDYLSEFYDNPERNKEILQLFEENEYEFVDEILYITERSFED